MEKRDRRQQQIRQRRTENDTVKPVQHTAVLPKQVAIIFQSVLTLDIAERQVPHLRHKASQQTIQHQYNIVGLHSKCRLHHNAIQSAAERRA